MNAIISRATWGARYRDGVGNRSVGRLEKYLHHTVTSHLSENATPAQERAAMRVIEQIGQQRFGRGISYTYIIFPSGRIYQGASTHRISYHSGGGRNTRGVGVCLAGNYETNRLGSKAFNAIVWLLQEGVRRGWWGDPALTSYHKQFRSTACPGKHSISRFNDLNSAGRGGKVTTTKTTPKKTSSSSSSSSSKDWPHVALPVTNTHTTASHNAWVYLMRHAVNRTDRNLTINIQRWLRDLGYDVGPDDGVFGPRTVRALQRFLASKNLYSGRIDGDRGPMTIRGEIGYLNQQRKYLI